LGLDPKMIRLAGRVSAVGIEIVVAIAIGYLAGRWLDRKFTTDNFTWLPWNTAPWLTILFTLCGVGAGIKALARANQEFQRAMKDEEKDGPP
jgi:F0F1-type ATP synthase assembly protein I